MKKIFNVIGICALISYLFIFSSCEESYDEEELNRDIQKKLAEMKAAEDARKAEEEAKKVDFVTFGADTFQLPVKVMPIFHEAIITEWPAFQADAYYTYSVDPADVEAVKQSLYEQTAALSEYGNFMLDRMKTEFTYGTPLKDALSKVTDEHNEWFYVGKDRELYTITFSEDSTNVSFRIKDSWYPMGPNETVEGPFLIMTYYDE